MTGVQIDPVAIYHDEDLAEGLAVSFQALARARSAGELRFRRLGKQIVYLGQWVLDWLAMDPAARHDSPAPNGPMCCRGDQELVKVGRN